MKSNMLRSLLHLTVVASALIAPAFLTLPAHAGPVLPEVGPDSDYGKVMCGYLKVTRARSRRSGARTPTTTRTPPTGFTTQRGKRIKTVSNHDTSIDEAPQKVLAHAGQVRRQGLVGR